MLKIIGVSIIIITTLVVNAQPIKWAIAQNMDPKLVFNLDCSSLKWDSLPMEIYQYTELRELNLSKNKISYLSDEFNNFQKLQKLNLGRNKLQFFPLIICQLGSLEELYLDRNYISKIPDQISFLEHLSKLDLFANSIEQFGQGIYLLPNLKVLNIEGVMYGTVFAKQLIEHLPNTKVLIDPPCKCLD